MSMNGLTWRRFTQVANILRSSSWRLLSVAAVWINDAILRLQTLLMLVNSSRKAPSDSDVRLENMPRSESRTKIFNSPVMFWSTIRLLINSRCAGRAFLRVVALRRGRDRLSGTGAIGPDFFQYGSWRHPDAPIVSGLIPAEYTPLASWLAKYPIGTGQVASRKIWVRTSRMPLRGYP